MKPVFCTLSEISLQKRQDHVALEHKLHISTYAASRMRRFLSEYTLLENETSFIFKLFYSTWEYINTHISIQSSPISHIVLIQISDGHFQCFFPLPTMLTLPFTPLPLSHLACSFQA